jgi:KDO2-lipid IV(A) lauroyltransferase
MPCRVAHAAGALLGWIWYYLIPVRRSVARANLRLAFPEKSEKERRKIARGCFVHLARSAVEFLRLPGLNRRKVDGLLEHTGWEHYEQALEKGRGAIVVTAHFGNFDLLACAQAVRGVPLHILTREQHVGGFNRYWMSVRAKLGVGLLPVKKSAIRIHRLLKDKQVVAMVIDQHAPQGRGVVVPFFNHPASTVHAPALLATTAKVPLLPATIERLPGGRHRVTLEPPVKIDETQPRDAEVLRVTRELNRWLENKIRARPDHWLWIHRRWKVGGLV